MLIAIEDTLSKDIAGAMIIFRHDAPAIRFFSDCVDNNPALKDHIEDYELVQYAYLDEDLTVVPERRTIITGEQFKAAREKIMAEAEDLKAQFFNTGR